MKACFLRCLLFCAALVIAGVVLILVNADRLPPVFANLLYPSFYPPYDDEAPPTPTTFPASSEIKAMIGGKGEGLSCSVPYEWLFFKNKDGAPLSLQFRQACAFHDYCYRHGAATYGYEQVDCDFMLVQHAYRICRMIYSNKDKMPDCWLRAREVLAGVRMGGGSFFQAQERSTYYEFDPMPRRADDFVVARLVRVPTASDWQEVVGATGTRRLQRAIFSYHFKRGTVRSRLLTWGDDMVTDKEKGSLYLFPPQAVATPPHVTATPTEDYLLAAAREGVASSNVWNVRFPTEFKSATAASARRDVTKGDDCVRRLAADPWINERIAPVKFYHQTESRLELLSLCMNNDHRIVIQDDRVFEPRAPDYPSDGKCNSGVTLPRFFDPEEHHDDYRLQQSEPLIGRFRDPGQEDVMVLSRGLDSMGKQYAENVKVYLASLYPRIPDESDRKINMLLPETSEPVAPVALADGRTGLLSVVADKVNRKTILQLRYLADCSSGKPCSPKTVPDLNTIPDDSTKLDDSWAHMPVQLLDSVKRPHANLLFFSRVQCRNSANPDAKPKPCAQFKESEPPPDEVVIDFEYRRLLKEQFTDQDKLPLAGSGVCRVSLAEQLEKGKKTDLYTLVTRTAGNDEEKKNLSFRDYARRWSMSQVIPGRIFAAESSSDRLDVAVIFNGYPGFSLLIAGTDPAASGSKGYGFEAFSPSYVRCD